MVEPFAVLLYRRFLSGESADDISAELGIPADRIRARIEAAAAHLDSPCQGLLALDAGARH